MKCDDMCFMYLIFSMLCCLLGRCVLQRYKILIEFSCKNTWFLLYLYGATEDILSNSILFFTN